MKILLLAFLLLIAAFSCISVSQSYASAQQARAVIEINHTAQLALVGQIAISILLAFLVILLLLMLLLLIHNLTKKQEGKALILKKRMPERKYPALGAEIRPEAEESEEFLTLPSNWGW